MEEVIGSNPIRSTKILPGDIPATSQALRTQWGQGLPPTDLRTQYLNPYSVVLEVSEAVGLALEDFHFGVEAFGDAVVSCESPHGGDFLSPRMEGITELDQVSQSCLLEIGDHAEQPGYQFPASFLVLMLLQQQIAELLFKPADQFQHGMFFQISRQFHMLFCAQIVSVAAHQREQTAIL